MRRIGQGLRVLLKYAIFVFLGLAFIYSLPIVLPGLLFWQPMCITETRGKITDIPGYEFEFSETSCDVIAKDDAVSVLASRVGSKMQTPVFKYDPYRTLIPKIESTGEHSVKISIPDIAEEFFRKEKFQDLSIQYDIGMVLYPDKPDKEKK